LLGGGGVLVATFDVLPDTFGPIAAGDEGTFGFTKVAGSLDPQNGCGVAACIGIYDVEIVFDVDGEQAVATGQVTVECVF
jgi:hypothetical protein